MVINLSSIIFWSFYFYIKLPNKLLESWFLLLHAWIILLSMATIATAYLASTGVLYYISRRSTRTPGGSFSSYWSSFPYNLLLPTPFPLPSQHPQLLLSPASSLSSHFPALPFPLSATFLSVLSSSWQPSFTSPTFLLGLPACLLLSLLPKFNWSFKMKWWPFWIA